MALLGFRGLSTIGNAGVLGFLLHRHHVRSFPGEFFFTGDVETINGQNYIKISDAITVKEDLIGYLAKDDEDGGDVDSMYQDLFDSNKKFDYNMCNSFCVTYWSNEREDLSENQDDQCVRVMQSDDEENVNTDEYLCCSNIMFVKRRRLMPSN